MNDISKIKPLCLSFWTPPVVRPQAILIGKMIPEWIRQGVKPVVITYEAGAGDWDISAEVYKIPQFKMSRFLSRIVPLRRLKWNSYYKKLAGTAEEIIKKHGCNIVFSFSNPQDSNIVGAMLKKNTGIPFVAHFSDPWSDHVYRLNPGRVARRILKLEKFVIDQCDKVIFITEETKRLGMKKYPAEYMDKAEVIPHCYGLNDYSEGQKKSAEKFVISYIGAFYKLRNPEQLFKALQIVKEKGINNFLIQLVGSANPYAGYSEEKVNNLVEKYGLKEHIEIIPVVPYKESLKLMKEADCLVVIDADVADSPFLTSKVVDYAGSGTVIVGITPDNSPTAQFLSALGHKSFNYKQTAELAEYMEKLIKGHVDIEVNKDFLSQFDVKATTLKLINIFKTCHCEVAKRTK